MIRQRTGQVLFLAAVLVAGMQTAAAQNSIIEELRKQWEATGNQIYTMAEAVPEAKYDFKPTPEVRSFREQLIHLASENYMFMGFAAGTGSPVDRSSLNDLRSRAEILQALTESYDYGDKVLADLNDQKLLDMVPFFRGRQVPRLAAIMGNIKDNHGHYGNLVVYMRLNGLVPPRPAPRPRQR